MTQAPQVKRKQTTTVHHRQLCFPNSCASDQKTTVPQSIGPQNLNRALYRSRLKLPSSKYPHNIYSRIISAKRTNRTRSTSAERAVWKMLHICMDGGGGEANASPTVTPVAKGQWAWIYHSYTWWRDVEMLVLRKQGAFEHGEQFTSDLGRGTQFSFGSRRKRKRSFMIKEYTFRTFPSFQYVQL